MPFLPPAVHIIHNFLVLRTIAQTVKVKNIWIFKWVFVVVFYFPKGKSDVHFVKHSWQKPLLDSRIFLPLRLSSFSPLFILSSLYFTRKIPTSTSSGTGREVLKLFWMMWVLTQKHIHRNRKTIAHFYGWWSCSSWMKKCQGGWVGGGGGGNMIPLRLELAFTGVRVGGANR